MATKLESLIVDLQLNTAELKKGVDSAVSQLEGIQGMLKGIAASAAFTIIADSAMAAAQAVGELVMRGAELLDQSGKQAVAAGVSAESFSKWAYAMRINDVSTEEFSKSIAHLGKELVAASQGGAKQEALFRSLGISVTDAAGSLRSADAVLMDLARSFATMPPSIAKSRLAVDLFGKGTENMALALSAGTEGLTELMNEADMFGLTVSGSAAAAADEFNDNLSRLKEIANGVAQEVAANVLPALNQLLERLLKSDALFEALDVTVNVVSTSIKILVAVVGGLATAFDNVVTAVGKAMKALEALRPVAAAALRGVAAVLPGVVGAASTVAAGLVGGDTSSGTAGAGAEGAAGAGATGSRHGAGGGTHAAMPALQKAANDAAKALAAAANAEKARTEAAQQAAAIERAAAESDRAMREQLADATRDAAEAERLQAHAVKESNEQLKKLAHDTAEASRNLMIGAVQTVASKLGQVGSMIQSAMQGFQTGGIYGAIIAVVADFASQLEGFTVLLDWLNNQLLGGMLKAIDQGFRPLAQALTGLLAPVLDSTIAGLEWIGKLLQPVAQVLDVVGDALQPIHDVLFGLFQSFEPLTNVVVPALTAVLDLFSLGILGLQVGFFRAIAWIQGVIRDIIDFFGGDSSQVRADITANDRKAAEAESRIAEITARMARDAAGVAADIDTGTGGVVVLGDAAEGAARTLNEFNSSLTNVPQGFRYAAAAFNAQDVAGGPGAFGMTPLAPVTVTVQGSVIAENDLLAMIEAAQRRDGFRKKGI